ncbi:MAG: DEAD/DEAH box helicase [Rhodospirillaceae bacterium]
MTHLSFSNLGVAEPLLRALASEDYHTPTPIQAQAIPPQLANRDVVGIAQTGTGKTAAFALPILQRLSEQAGSAGPRGTRALILAPTRELAIQIAEAIKVYGKYLNLRTTVIFGGVGQDPQVKAMANGVDILVATPGRLLDLINQRHVRLDKASYLVLDEADRMLDMGFVRDVRKIISHLPRERQSLLFSATMPQDIARLATDMLRDPVRVEVTPQVITVDKIDQQVFFVDAGAKRALLSSLLDDQALERVIVFTRTKHGANRVTEHLENAGIAAEAIHGNKSQSARQRALENFRSGIARVLVATDIAARGIDVDDITHVINFELPNIPESYVHRVGRTARAGARGIALSFCDPSERAFLRDIEKLTRRPLAVIDSHPAMTAAKLAPQTPPRAAPPSHHQQPRRDQAHAQRRPSPQAQSQRPSTPQAQSQRPSTPQAAQSQRPTSRPGPRPDTRNSPRSVELVSTGGYRP